MEIILSKQCKFLCGSLGKGFGYHIQRRTDLDGKIRFWGVRQSKGEIPANGHLRFILTCAELAQNGLHIADIRVSREELKQALYEAHGFVAMQNLRKDLYDARDILNLKTTFSL